MKTKRKTPRVLALLLCILSLPSFFYGTSALAKIQHINKNSLLDSMTAGSTTYTLANLSKSDSCLGLLTIELQPKISAEDDSSLKFHSQFTVSDGTQNYPVELTAIGEFNPLGELHNLDITFNFDKFGSLRIQGGQRSTPLVATLASNTGTSESISLFILDRIYLREMTKGIFRLRLPQSLVKLTNSIPIGHKSNLEFLPIDDKDPTNTKDSCQQLLASSEVKPLLSIPLAKSGLNSSTIINALKQKYLRTL